MWAYVREWVINAFLKKDETVRSHKTQMWFPDIRNQRTHIYVCIDSLERIHKSLMRNMCYLDRYYAFLWLQCRVDQVSILELEFLSHIIIIIFIIQNALLFHVADKIESFEFGLVMFIRVRLERKKIELDCANTETNCCTLFEDQTKMKWIWKVFYVLRKANRQFKSEKSYQTNWVEILILF